MKTLYTLLLLLFGFTGSTFGQCKANIQIDHTGIAQYTFTALPVYGTAQYTRYFWYLNSDTITTDSTLLHTTHTVDTNGSYQICLHVTDSTNSACNFDTCLTFQVTDAEYGPLDSAYQPMLDTISVWYFVSNIEPVTLLQHNAPRSNNCQPSFIEGWVNYTAGDTVIGGVYYRQFWSVVFHNDPPCLQGFIREDTAGRKVYFLDTQGSPEILLYDFSMTIGQIKSLQFDNTFQVYFGNGNYRLDSIKPFITKAGLRRAFYLNCVNCVSASPLIWVEGMGNTGAMVYPQSYNSYGSIMLYSCGQQDFPYTFSSILTCFQHNSQVYSDTCVLNAAVQNQCLHMSDSCSYDYVCVGIQEIASLSSFSVSPNPATDNVNINMEVKEGNNFSLTLQSLDGKMVMTETNLGWLPAGNYNKTISIHRLSSGIYLVGCKTNEGTVYKKLVVQ